MKCRPLMPFYACAPEQLDRRWLDCGYGVEAIMFAGSDLRALPSIGRTLRGLSAPHTIHFPMNDADYVHDTAALEGLWRTIDTALECRASGVVAHSNCFVRVLDLPFADVAGLRARCLEIYAVIDEYLRGSDLWLGIENMPLMGDLGDDVDPPFVFLEDFAGFKFEHVVRVLDTAHWAGTWDTLEYVQAHGVPRELLPPTPVEPLRDTLAGGARIGHIHLSAAEGVAVPAPAGCETRAAGGGIPRGPEEAKRYEPMVTPVLDSDITVSLEVREDDYRVRENLWRALAWLTDMVEARTCP